MSATSFINDLAEVLLGTVGTLGGQGGLGSRRLKLDAAAERAFALLQEAKRTGRTVFAVGNGGSQVIAQHVEMDLCNRAGMRARSFSSTPVVTALANDHAYDEVYARLIRSQGDAGDVLLAVSSSGQSRNIVAAAEAARAMGMPVVTFSGFEADNPLRSAGDLNFWVDSKSYGLVELAHEALVHHLSDRCVEAERAEQAPAAGSADAEPAAAAKAEVHVVARHREHSTAR